MWGVRWHNAYMSTHVRIGLPHQDTPAPAQRRCCSCSSFDKYGWRGTSTAFGAAPVRRTRAARCVRWWTQWAAWAQCRATLQRCRPWRRASPSATRSRSRCYKGSRSWWVAAGGCGGVGSWACTHEACTTSRNLAQRRGCSDSRCTRLRYPASKQAAFAPIPRACCPRAPPDCRGLQGGGRRERRGRAPPDQVSAAGVACPRTLKPTAPTRTH